VLHCDIDSWAIEIKASEYNYHSDYMDMMNTQM